MTREESQHQVSLQAPPSRKRIEPAKFKKDYVAALAVLFFLLMVVTEITLAVGLPLYIKRTSMWAEQVARQELIGYFDYLRGAAGSASPKLPQAKSELELVTNNLNLLAIYLRENSAKLSMAQIKELRDDLRGFDRVLERLTRDMPYGVILPLNTKPAVNKVADALDAAGANRTGGN